MTKERQPVPVRTILATLGFIALAWVAYLLLTTAQRTIAWLLVALFFTVVLTPAVDFLQHKWHFRRGLAAGLVFLVVVALFAAMIYTFVKPIVDQAQKFADDLPRLVEDARAGKGTVGHLVKRYKIDDWVNRNQSTLKDAAKNLRNPAINFIVNLFNTAVAVITIGMLTLLMLIQGPTMSAGSLSLVPSAHRERARNVARQAAKAISGYMFGNLVISVIAGIASYIFLRIAGVPYPEVLALWVAFTDLIPLVGATLGAVGVGAVAFLHSVPAGIITVIFFIIYQQFENQVLQVTVMAKTVRVPALAVLVSALVGVELLGLLGALFAIPIAGVIQVVWSDQRAHGHFGGVPEPPGDVAVATGVIRRYRHKST